MYRYIQKRERRNAILNRNVIHVNKVKQGKANGSTQDRQLISKKMYMYRCVLLLLSIVPYDTITCITALKTH